VAYLDRIEHYRERYRCIVYAYVLMSNHVHLLIETGAVGLSKIMQGIQFSYTQRYNRRYRVVGHLFQGRYKAIRCKSGDCIPWEIPLFLHSDIFRDESDRVAYLDRIEHYRERYRCIVYAYVLMSDHVHLLIETGAVRLSKIMEGI
jgi:REP element-mobilizing transposase RayT